MKTVPERIKGLREDNDLLQSQVAEVLGITQQTYSNYETGIHEPPLRHIKRLAVLYSVSCDYILDISQLKLPPDKISNLLEHNPRIAFIIDTIVNLTPQDISLVADFVKMLHMREGNSHRS